MEDIMIRKLIDAGIRAPSGENCQPWKFIIKRNIIELYNLSERDNSLYNWGQRASYVAHGALLENMIITAQQFGYNLSIDLFPDGADPNLIAYITITKTTTKNDPLYDSIFKRSTNRKPYRDIPLSREEKNQIITAGNVVSEKKVYLRENPEEIQMLADLTALNEKILLENLKMHNFFFSHINWTKKEDRERGIGFYIKTFELSPPAQVAFNLFSYWKLLEIFNKIGASDFVVKQNAKVYNSSAAFCAIIIQNKNPEDFIVVGRIMQRLWLTATKLNLSCQPLTGILFLMRRIEVNDTKELSLQHVIAIKNAYEKMKHIFGVTNGIIAMIFRLGQGDSPTAHAIRLPPDIIIKT